MSDLKRTPTTPKKPGFYWLWKDGDDPQIVEIVIEGDFLIVYMPGSNESFHLDDATIFNELTCDWAGPLEPPI